MSMQDPIADFITRIRNANRVYKKSVSVPSSKIKVAMAEILKTEGFIDDFKVNKEGIQGNLRVYLKYSPDRRRAINGLRRISRPGLRVYVDKDRIPRVLGGLGLAILSTSKGVLSDKASRRGAVGGEVLCYVW